MLNIFKDLFRPRKVNHNRPDGKVWCEGTPQHLGREITDAEVMEAINSMPMHYAATAFNQIIRTSPPKGVFSGGKITGTPLPGTHMQIDPAAVEVGGRNGWEVYQPGTNGQVMPIWILLEDDLQGKTITDAYVSGTYGRMYAPVMGEELYCLVSGSVWGVGSGTVELPLGQAMIPESGTGLLIKSAGTPGMTPWIIKYLYDITLAAQEGVNQLIRCEYTGN